MLVKQERVLISPEDIQPTKGFEVLGVFNPGAVRLPNGDILLYIRVTEKLIKHETGKFFLSPRFVGKDKFKIKLDRFKKSLVEFKSEVDFVFKDGTKRLTYISHLRKVILDKDGFTIKSIDKKPSFFGTANDGELGIEDARITQLGKRYIMTYVSLSRLGGVSASYASSKNLKNWKRGGIIFHQQNKDVVIFPEKTKKGYIAIHRPEGTFEFTHPHLWVSYSDDFNSWRDPEPLNISKRGDWDFGRKGAGPPPIKTKKGWLLLYHATMYKISRRKSFASSLKKFLGFNTGEEPKKVLYYFVGAALFDSENPARLIAKTKKPLISPYKKYEKVSFEPKRVVFPTGIVIDDNKEDLLIYFGAGDRVVTVKKIGLKSIMRELKKVKQITL